MYGKAGCVVAAGVMLAFGLSAQTTRIWAVNAGSATRYGDFAPDTNTGNWYGIPAATNLADVAAPAPAGVYESLKYSPSAFAYTAGALQPGGRYTLRLHYNDNWTDHTFSLAVNGTQVEAAFNPVVAAGNRKQYAVIREYAVVASSTGTVALAFAGAGGGCVVSGIEVVEGATNNLIRPHAAFWPVRVPESNPASYTTVATLYWPERVYGNLLTNVFTVFRATNSVDGFKAVAVVTNVTRYTDADLTPGATNRYFVKRGAFAGPYAGEPGTNDVAALVLSSGSSYATPYRQVWAVNCGYSGADVYGQFAVDQGYTTPSTASSSGTAIEVPSTLDAAAQMNVYQTCRWSNPGFSYSFAVLPDRVYRLRLHVAEAWGVTNRAFNIAVNGSTVTNNYSPAAAAGGVNRAAILEHDCWGDSNSVIQIGFTLGSVNFPQVGGIELVESVYAPLPGGELPVTVSNTWEAVAEVRSRVGNTSAYSGTVWRAESPSGAYVSLGRKPFNSGRWGDTPESGLQTNRSYRYVVRLDGAEPGEAEPGAVLSGFVRNRYSVWMGSSNLLHYLPPTGFLTSAASLHTVTKGIDRSYVSGAAPLAVYQQQRYNNPLSFSFSNLHALATYRLRLHAAETYFAGLGSRKVNIVVNGQTLYGSFDAAAYAGAADRATAPEFAVPADAQGLLAVTLSGVNQTPLLAALEVRAVPLSAAPAALAAAPGSAKVRLTWSPVAGADGYAVYRTAAGGQPEALGTVFASAFSDSTGTVGVMYTYTVRPYNEFGEGPASIVSGVRYPALKGTLISVL